jgi:hypothetical protein
LSGLPNLNFLDLYFGLTEVYLMPKYAYRLLYFKINKTKSGRKYEVLSRFSYSY